MQYLLNIHKQFNSCPPTKAHTYTDKILSWDVNRTTCRAQNDGVITYDLIEDNVLFTEI